MISRAHIDSFSGKAANLPPRDRTPTCILRALVMIGIFLNMPGVNRG
ncbi:hypothetical protein [Nevskia sp.]|nr:hypothetical protein [Nevskia sp.]